MTVCRDFSRVLACLVALAVSLPSIALPQAKDEVTEQARAYFEQGRTALRAGKAEAARLVLERAYQLRPTPQIAFWLGLAELDMGLFVEAADHMALYMHQFPASAEEKKSFADAEANVAHLYFDVNVDRVHIYLDNEDLGNTPFVFQPVYALAGRRVIRATCRGFKPVVQTYDVVAGKRTDIRIVLEKDDNLPPPSASSSSSSSASAASGAATIAAPPPPNHIPPRSFWQEPRNVAVGSGAALTIAAGILYAVETLRASSLRSDISDLAPRVGTSGCVSGVRQDCDRSADLTEQRRTAIDVSRAALVGAAIFGTATAATWFLWPRSRVQMAPHVTPSQAGISISGEL